MKQKILKPQTIIPSTLYTYRAADRQLRDVIEDMGRPGYVLVSRQMGKTNLLLNAKRELQNENTVFAYIDLSNKFDELRGCFRNIVDTAIDANFLALGAAREAVDRFREINGEKLPPHKEHEQELLVILRTFPGKLIVVLDEIDALGNVDFSDQLFAQIRSVYFSRANFPEYGRLTYILSGVAEPSEIIKNKNVSPFNIGEKIYLDDFSYDEFCEFLKKAGLNLAASIIDRIFHWTSGSPRLTWDVSASIEDEIISGNEITEDLVDFVVKRLYLNTYDRPPVDHIRKLCEDHRDVRRAIVDIRAARYAELTDSIRKRLYLAGVIRSSEFSSQIVSIKNLIIDSALGDEWLMDIDKKSIGLRRLGDEKFDQRDFKTAIQHYQDYFDQEHGKIPEITKYRAASSCYFLDRHEDALKYFEDLINGENEENASLLASALYYAAHCDISLKNYFAAIQKYERLKDMESEFSVSALANLASTYAKIDIKEHSEKIISCYKAAIRSITEKSNPSDANLLCTSHWNLGEAYLAVDNREEAKSSYEKAWEVSPPSWRASICMRLIGLRDPTENWKSRISTVIDEIINKKIEFAESGEYSKLALSPLVLHDLLLTALANDLDSKFDQLCEYTIKELFPDSSKFKLWRDLADGARAVGEHSLAKKLLPIVQRTCNDDPQQLPTEGLQVVLSVSNPYEFGSFETAYLQRLEDESIEELVDKFTFFWITTRMAHAHTIGNIKLIERLLCYADKIRPKISRELQINYLAVDYVAMQVGLSQKKWKQASERAQSIVDHIPEQGSKNLEFAFFSKEELEIIEKQAIDISKAFPSNFIEPFIRGKKYGKNEYLTVIYKTGKISRVKYKKVQADIELGLCDIAN